METDDDRLALLRATHRALSAEMRILKRELRERVGRMEAVQRRLDSIEQAGSELANEVPSPRGGGS
ncbi:MAG: hypothetical protein ACLP3C_23285 [Mycobacterium sp.]|uniref:hypothetical protein n=1 Tax=Mycobacterium sp. TaxID=1785 RepID=UPI003F9CDCDB